MDSATLLPPDQPIAMIDSRDENRHSEVHVVATRDHELVRRWAQRRHAEPATGQATDTGPQTIDVHDQGTALRFNFPGVERFRQIEWTEWLDHFDQHTLVFVYERDAPGVTPSNRYRLLPARRLEQIAHVRP
jgi:hypothetical protein